MSHASRGLNYTFCLHNLELLKLMLQTSLPYNDIPEIPDHEDLTDNIPALINHDSSIEPIHAADTMIDGTETTCSNQGPNGCANLVLPTSLESDNLEVTIIVASIHGSSDDINIMALVHLYPPLNVVRLICVFVAHDYGVQFFKKLYSCGPSFKGILTVDWFT